MRFLQRVLIVQAALWTVVGVSFGVAPAFTVREILDQRVPSDGAWIRMLGVTSVVLALYMVLVARHVTDSHRWAWGFALLEAGIATVALLNAAFGVPAGSLAWAWWVVGVGAVVLGSLDVIGIVRAQREESSA